ncbi:hypothetical protein TUM20985_40160 [Mycobacterium antarcticum]|uniref:hypothetical protein n=1 Tax=unclassified Mycolicibacterium TaxID=2636767 RepID=UPI0023A6C1C8|nr:MULTISPECIES: hypothetical protein [unclassified Mycolicibacterium]BDX33469.1 hypothetical protein TUM20985_40160 [Mycolicibacterium sp. TUM20985]GLP82918.1 hypothetical protein TUM20984_43380 [Mycolicibacterium sp. TUM20984]
MRGFVNLGGASSASTAPRPDPGHVRTLKAVVAEVLRLDAEATVVVQQLACVEPGCPPVETVVAVLGTARRTWKFARSTADVSSAELGEHLTDYPEGHHHDHAD